MRVFNEGSKERVLRLGHSAGSKQPSGQDANIRASR
jgi:hypothetical protein